MAWGRKRPSRPAYPGPNIVPMGFWKFLSLVGTCIARYRVDDLLLVDFSFTGTIHTCRSYTSSDRYYEHF